MTRLRWLIAGLILAAVLGFGIYSCHGRQVVTQQVQQADQQHQQGATHETQGTTHDQAANTLQPALDKAIAEVARLKAKLAAIKPPTEPLVPIPNFGTDDPNPCALQDQIIAAQDVRYGALEAQHAEVAVARDEHKAAAQAYKSEATSLRTALAHIPEARPWAVGVLYGTDKTAGAWVEYDFGPVRVGADVVRHQINETGRTTLEGTLRLGWRFK